MFVFDCTAIIGYHAFQDFLEDCKGRFLAEKTALFREYGVLSAFEASAVTGYFEFRRKYRELRQNVIREVIARFRNFLPEKCLIYEFGSLVKLTDRIESDIDLTISYDEPKNSVRETAELLINYTIVTIFEHPIDHIHGKFQHYPVTDAYDALTPSDNRYELRFDAGTVVFSCPWPSFSENIMNIKNVRDYASLIAGYAEKYALRCNIDCLYSIVILENTSGHDFIGDLAALEDANDIFAGYCHAPASFSPGDTVSVSRIKKALKGAVVDMYVMMACLRKRRPWLREYSMTAEEFFENQVMRDFLGESYLKELKARFIAMTFYWDKIELCLKKRGIPLSARHQKDFTAAELNGLLLQDYQKTEMLSEIVTAVNDLNDAVTAGWEIINRKTGREQRS